MAALTEIAIQNLKPGSTRREVPDPGARGLYVVVQPSGRKGFAVRYRNAAGRSCKLTLPPVSLAAARKLTADTLLDVAQGREPGTIKQAKREAAAVAARADDTIERLADVFIEKHAKKKTRENSWRQTVHIFHDIVVPAWRGRLVHDIVRRDVIELLEDVAEDRPILANRVLAALSKYFAWMCERDIVVASPCIGVKRPSEETERERFLGDDEIRKLWAACDAIGGPAGACIKVLLLTGQRRSEVGGMRRSELSGDVWSLPPARTKNKRQHDVPLSRQALELIEAMPQIGESDYVFTTGRAPLGHFDRAKQSLDEQMQLNQAWVLHDLRRTAASGMARLGIRLPVIEKVLNHSSGTFRGVVKVYQRHDFAAEKREALQRWADHVEQLVTGKSAKVIKLRR